MSVYLEGRSKTGGCCVHVCYESKKPLQSEGRCGANKHFPYGASRPQGICRQEVLPRRWRSSSSSGTRPPTLRPGEGTEGQGEGMSMAIRGIATTTTEANIQ